MPPGSSAGRYERRHRIRVAVGLAAALFAAGGVSYAAVEHASPPVRDAGTTPGLHALPSPATTTTAPLRTVGLGDSITQGNSHGPKPGVSWFGQMFAGDQRLTFAWNAGVFGNTTAGMIARFHHDVAAHHPQLVTIMGGTNDIGQGVRQSVTIRNLTTLVADVRAIHAVPVLCDIPPRNDTTLVPKITRLNAAIYVLADRLKVTVLRLHDTVAAPSGIYLPKMTDDGVHPSYAGHQKMALAADSQLAAVGY